MAKKAKNETKKTSTAKEAINLKQVGQNIMLEIDGKSHSKRFPNRANREALKGKVEAYNKRPSKAKFAEIVNIMSGEKTTEEQRKEKAKKGGGATNKKPAAAQVPAKESEIEKAKKLLQEEGYVISKNAPRHEPTRRRGEY